MVTFTQGEREKKKQVARVFVKITKPLNVYRENRSENKKIKDGTLRGSLVAISFLCLINKAFNVISGLISRVLRYL